MNLSFYEFLIKITNASECALVEVIQSLWSGYGKISRYQLTGSAYKTVVVKHISLSTASDHPRGWDSETSHQRKVTSYEVETHWYKQWNQQCSNSCRTPHFLGSFSEGQDRWIVLEDLDEAYGLRKSKLAFSEVKSCLKWLANFHAAFLGKEPSGLWPVGSYWHLDTRLDEFHKIEHQELKSKAHLIDQALKNTPYQTIIHGDAKLANFCFSENGNDIAAVDFQYVGRGCGMKDVAYFLGSCLSSDECELYQDELLNFYFSELKKVLNPEVDFSVLNHQWLKMYPMACADFMRFMMGWMPSHQKINGYNLRLLNSVLAEFKIGNE